MIGVDLETFQKVRPRPHFVALFHRHHPQLVVDSRVSGGQLQRLLKGCGGLRIEPQVMVAHTQLKTSIQGIWLDFRGSLKLFGGQGQVVSEQLVILVFQQTTHTDGRRDQGCTKHHRMTGCVPVLT